MSRSGVHRLGRRRRLRRIRRGAGGLRLPPTRTAWTTSPQRRCSARASSGTGRCRRAELPPGGRLGIYGFGASAHLVAQVAIAQGATVHVLTRAAEARRARARPRRGLGRTRRRRTARTTRRRRALRPGGRARPDRDARRSTRAARSPSPASTSATSPRSPTPTSCSARSSSAASPPTPGPTARSSFGWLPAAHPADDDAAPLGRSRSGAGRPGRRPDHRRRRARSLTAPARRGRHSRARGRHGRPRERPRRPLR